MKREVFHSHVVGSCFRLVALVGLLPFMWGCPGFGEPECQPGELRVAALFDTIVDEGTLVNIETIFLCQPVTGGAVNEQTFQWVQVSPASPVAAISGANSANASFVAPLVDQDTEFVFQVNVRMVSENRTFEASDTVNVTVRNVEALVAEQPAPPSVPVPNQLVNEGQNIQLDPANLFDLSSFDNQVLGFVWEQLQPTDPVLDISDPNAAMPTVPVLFPNPVMGSQIEVIYQLTVDVAPPAGAAIPSGQVVPTSLPAIRTMTLMVNQFPEADAGDTSFVVEGNLAQLDGTGSYDPEDPENPAALTYFWELIDFIATPITPSGPEDVVLDDPTSPTPSFMAPPVTIAGAILVFQLTVSDGVIESTDTTEVFLLKIPGEGPGAPVNPCDGVVCPDGFVCDPAIGDCVPTNPCEDVVCDEGLVCDPQTGTCVDPCENVECPQDSFCVFGECVCEEGFIFNDELGVCLPDLCADVVCLPNSTCSGQGFCDCDPGFEFNPNGDCVPVDPCADVVCGQNEICVNEGGEPTCVCDIGLAFECEEIYGGFFNDEACECEEFLDLN